MQTNTKEININDLIKGNNISISLSDDEIGDEHICTGIKTPLRTDAFSIIDEEKISKISIQFKEIMETLGLDLNDDSLKGTPGRVAKMYVKEIFNGLNPDN
ncbi:MAG: GTP cyclohydrolase I, partial [Bacteroidota bacterium]